jgi:hypothetical protein
VERNQHTDDQIDNKTSGKTGSQNGLYTQGDSVKCPSSINSATPAGWRNQKDTHTVYTRDQKGHNVQKNEHNGGT